jgi:hypothetical protein
MWKKAGKLTLRKHIEKNNLLSHRREKLKSHKLSLNEPKKQGLITDINFSLCSHSLILYTVTAWLYVVGHTHMAGPISD